MLEKTGIPTSEEVEQKVPDKKRLEQGPVAIVECFKEIPCDPCYHSCPVGAFAEFDDINDIPVLDFDKCTGCGNCIASCPGLAIFVVDYTYGSKNEGLLRLPFEFLPLPEEGQKVTALNRAGEEVCRGRVEKVQNSESLDKTPIIWLLLPAEFLMEVRHIKVGDNNG